MRSLVHGDTKTAFTFSGWSIVQVRIVDFTEFPAQVQAHATALCHGGKKRLKQFCLIGGWHPTASINDVDLALMEREIEINLDARRLISCCQFAVTQCIIE